MEVIDLDETFKNTGPVFFRNADSGVSHTDFHFIFFRLIKDCNTPFACEFDRIIDEIGYYLQDTLRSVLRVTVGEFLSKSNFTPGFIFSDPDR